MAQPEDRLSGSDIDLQRDSTAITAAVRARPTPKPRPRTTAPRRSQARPAHAQTRRAGDSEEARSPALEGAQVNGGSNVPAHPPREIADDFRPGRSSRPVCCRGTGYSEVRTGWFPHDNLLPGCCRTATNQEVRSRTRRELPVSQSMIIIAGSRSDYLFRITQLGFESRPLRDLTHEIQTSLWLLPHGCHSSSCLSPLATRAGSTPLISGTCRPRPHPARWCRSRCRRCRSRRCPRGGRRRQSCRRRSRRRWDVR
jgi:hypothetical protein